MMTARLQPGTKSGLQACSFFKNLTMRILLLSLFLMVTLFSCKSKSSKEKEQEQKETGLTDSATVLSPPKDSLLLNLSKAILTAFKNKDYTALALLMHPDDGVRFSPYGYVDTLNDRIFKSDWILKQAGLKKQEKVLWGEFDGTGDPINQTLDEYNKEFIYDVDFLHPEKSTVNHFLGAGNSPNNLAVVYPGLDFTESWFSGFDKRYEGMDWRSLRLVFKLKNGKYYLVGVVHDEWTI